MRSTRTARLIIRTAILFFLQQMMKIASIARILISRKTASIVLTSSVVSDATNVLIVSAATTVDFYKIAQTAAIALS